MNMTKNITVKKNHNEMYKMIIIAQFIYEGTSSHSVQLLSQDSAFLNESSWSCMELESIYANHLCHMKLVAKPERDSAKHRYKFIECMQVNNIFDRGTR